MDLEEGQARTDGSNDHVASTAYWGSVDGVLSIRHSAVDRPESGSLPARYAPEYNVGEEEVMAKLN